jgi:hypothetical protein
LLHIVGIVVMVDLVLGPALTLIVAIQISGALSWPGISRSSLRYK